MFKAVALSFSPAKGDTPVRLKIKNKGLLQTKGNLFRVFILRKKALNIPEVSDDPDWPVAEQSGQKWDFQNRKERLDFVADNKVAPAARRTGGLPYVRCCGNRSLVNDLRRDIFRRAVFAVVVL